MQPIHLSKIDRTAQTTNTNVMKVFLFDFDKYVTMKDESESEDYDSMLDSSSVQY